MKKTQLLPIAAIVILALSGCATGATTHDVVNTPGESISTPSPKPLSADQVYASKAAAIFGERVKSVSALRSAALQQCAEIVKMTSLLEYQSFVFGFAKQQNVTVDQVESLLNLTASTYCPAYSSTVKLFQSADAG